jgi:hypothetical protein
MINDNGDNGYDDSFGDDDDGIRQMAMAKTVMVMKKRTA